MPVFSFSGLSGIYCILNGGIRSKRHLLPTHTDKRSPFAFCAVNALVAAGVVRLCADIAHIIRPAGFSQVFPSVVGFLAVDVVNFIGPASFDYRENNAVRFEVPVVDGDVPVPIVGADAACSIPGVFCIPGLDVASGRLSGLPDKIPGFFVVMEKLMKSANVWRSHVVTSFNGVVRGLDIGVSSSRHFTKKASEMQEAFA